MAYRFNGSGDYVQFALAPFSGTTFGAYTMAVFFKQTGTASGRVIQAFTDSADQYRLQVDFSGTSPRLISDAGNHAATATQALSSTTIYYLLVVTWAGGAATPRFHVHDGTSWVHANAASGDALNTAIAGTDKLKVATRNPAANTIAGDFVCVGVKKSDSSDATVQTLTRTAFQDWRNFGFDWLIGFDSSLVSGGALQDQASPGTGDQTAISGTSVVSDPAGWAWTSVTTPVADFTGTPLTGVAPYTVTFTDTSTNTPTSWAWTFGDGGTSTAQNPTHSYTTPGTYTVVLVATNSAGSNTKTRTAYVTVGSSFVPQIVGIT